MERENSQSWGICGHSKTVAFLQSLISSAQLDHAYLFSGPDHVGKTTVATKFAQAILCQQTVNQPCGECQDCRLVVHGSHPDLFRLADGGGRSIGIDEVRDLRSRLQQGTLLGGYKIGLITTATTLTVAAANSLLKILEEPASKTILLLVARHPEALPATIASRCQLLELAPVPENAIADWLAGSVSTSGDNLSPVAAAMGRPGLAYHWTKEPDLFQRRQEQANWLLQAPKNSLAKRLKGMDLVDWSTEESVNRQQVRELINWWRGIIRLQLQQQTNPVFWLRALEQLAQIEAYLVNNIKAKNLLEFFLISL